MSRLYLICILALLSSTCCGSSLIVDDFESGNLSAWNVEAPYYTTLSLASPGAGGSNHALAIQETTGSGGAHSENALAHRKFTTPQNWSGYTTLELDAKATTAEWNGYSIRIYNNGVSVALRGIQSQESTGDFRRVKFDISGVQRGQIDEIVVYVNRTRNNAGQTLTIDNLQVSTTPVSTPSEVMIADFDTVGTSISRWQEPPSAVYQTNASFLMDGSYVVALALTGTSSAAYAQFDLPQTADWYDYKTLQFDAKLAAGTSRDGFSVRLYNRGDTRDLRVFMGDPEKIAKFSPGAGSYVTCKVDISGATRDQVSSLMFYVNRTSASAGQVVRIDNIKITKEVLATPDVVYLDTFDTYADNAAMQMLWDWVQSSSSHSLNTLDFISAPKSLDISLIGTSTSAYARRSWIVGGQQTMDWGDYKSLMFEAKIVRPDPNKPSYPVGFSANIVSPTSYNLWFYPSQFEQWETIALDLTDLTLDQVSWLRLYHNRSGRNNTGEILRIDDLRISKEPAPPVVISSPNVDDFEDGNIDDWYYTSVHEYPQGSGNYVSGVTTTLTNDAASGQYAVKITCNTPPGSSNAYGRKTLHAKWDGYTTLQFDAKVANSTTSEGFAVMIGNVTGNQAVHPFSPTNQWKTFKINISSDARDEVGRLIFYVNRITSYGRSQSGAQELYLDNIQLTNEVLTTEFSTIGEAMAQDDGVWVTLDGKVCTGQFPDAMVDRYDFTTLRKIIMIEESDRSSAVPVMLGFDAGSSLDVPPGTSVRLTGQVTTLNGTRILYCDALSKIDVGSGVSGFSSGFEPPTYAADATVAGVDGWTQTGGQSAQVWCQTTDVHGGTQALRIRQPTTGTSSVALLHDFSGYGAELLQVEYWAMPFDTTDSTGVWIAIEQDGSSSKRAALFGFRSGVIAYNNGGVWVNSTTSYTVGQWYRLAAVVNYTTRKWDFYVNGSLFASNLGFYSGTAHAFPSNIRFYKGGSNAGMAVDDITITVSGRPSDPKSVPEPVGMTNKICGSGDRGLDAGVPSFSGRSTTGMYATVYGRVLNVGMDFAANPPKYWLYIDDGSSVEADNGETGLKVYDWTGGTYASSDNIGKFAVVSGFVMNDLEIDPGTMLPTGKAVRAFWPKLELDQAIRFVD